MVGVKYGHTRWFSKKGFRRLKEKFKSMEVSKTKTTEVTDDEDVFDGADVW